jgi:integrase
MLAYNGICTPIPGSVSPTCHTYRCEAVPTGGARSPTGAAMAAKRSTFGAIAKLPSGRFRARYRSDGQWVNAEVTFTTKTDARLWLDGQRTDLTRGALKAPKRCRYTVDEYGAQWIRQRPKLKASTRAQYELDWRLHVSPWLGTMRLDKLTPDGVRQWNAQLAEHLESQLTQQRDEQLAREATKQAAATKRGRAYVPRGPSTATKRDGSATVARAYRLLRSVLSTAVTDELLPANPCRIQGAGTARSAERPTLALPEVDALAAAVPDRYAMLAHLLAWSGVRIGEAAALQRRDLDLNPDTPTVTVRERTYLVSGVYELDTPKSRAGLRTVALPPHLVGPLQLHLDEYTAAEPTGLVFTTATGGTVLSTYSQVFSRALARIGRTDVRVHDLRHTGMTFAAQAGASLAELKQRLGQSSTAAAEIYLHTNIDHGREVANRMSEQAASQDNVVPLRRATR